MTIARIVEADRKATQSGKFGTGRWQLEFERSQAQRPDPLTGWNGSGDTRTQVRLSFKTKEDAIAYAEKQGFDYHVVPAAKTSLKIQAYADNFR
ncbi:ETC complex I subunit [Sphingomonas alba]|uniref:ETC complex I subunit n=1 Tax=Sphingomonas alba TaxID=2908208 RepID=A0ABT0RPG0_9SPHN|nr:ETC complex I subunit [Sphingomonas alba]MCL6684448.1 ETC complex I subunit [Sphingomonas alba]